MFRNKYSRIESEVEQEKRAMKLLQAELGKARRERDRYRKELALAEEGLRDAQRRSTAKQEQARGSSERLEQTSRRMSKTHNTKLDLTILLERQKEQTIAARGILQKYERAVADLKEKVELFQRERDDYQKGNQALMDEVTDMMDRTEEYERKNSELDSELSKLRDILMG